MSCFCGAPVGVLLRQVPFVSALVTRNVAHLMSDRLRSHLRIPLQELMEEALISLNNAKQELDFTKTGEDAESLQAALEEAAASYKALHIKACSAGVPVPKEAMIQSNEHSVWSKEDLIGARDWMKFADAGWTVMEDLPELPEIFDTTFYIAHNQSEPPDVIVPISAALLASELT